MLFSPQSQATLTHDDLSALSFALSLTLPGATLAINDILPLTSLSPPSLSSSLLYQETPGPYSFPFEDKGQGRRGACRGWEWGLSAGWPSFKPFLFFLQSPSALNEVIQSISFSGRQPAVFKVLAHHTWPFLFSHSTHTHTHIHIAHPFSSLINTWIRFLGCLLRCSSPHTRERRERKQQTRMKIWQVWENICNCLRLHSENKSKGLLLLYNAIINRFEQSSNMGVFHSIQSTDAIRMDMNGSPAPLTFVTTKLINAVTQIVTNLPTILLNSLVPKVKITGKNCSYL